MKLVQRVRALELQAEKFTTLYDNLVSSKSGDRVLTTWGEIAHFFRRPVSTVRYWARKKGLPYSRHGRYAMTTEELCRRWIVIQSRKRRTDSKALSLPPQGGKESP